jgi:outer membrane lipoprotein carrier protein
MAFPQPHVQSGTVRIERPARMRWDYEHPTRRSYRTDGTTLWIVDELDRTCTVVEPLDPSFARMVAFLSGHGELERDYKVSAVPAEGALGPGLRLLPRAEADGFREILLRLDPGTGLVSTVRTESSFGDVTETVLEGLRVVPDLPDDVFTWDSPPGYRLIRAQ